MSTAVCPVCLENPIEGKQKYCSSTCRSRASRNTPVKTGQAHAVKCDKDTPGAVWRSVSIGENKPGHWVIPGRHMVGDIETSCLDPDHTNMEAVA